jgi:cobalt-zinc-cadmium efflux system protein
MSGHHHHDHTHDHHHHEGLSNQARLAFTIVFNIIITITEFIGGILSGSLALISDAGHNLSDVLSLILGYAGERVSRAKPGPVYTFGLKRFEVVIAMLNALSLVGIGVFIVYEAVARYLDPVPIRPEILIPVALVGLAGNAISIMVLHRSKDASLNMKAAFLHLLYDAVSSVAVVLVGVAMIFWNLPVLDLAVSLLIVIMIAYSSIGIIREAMRIFMQGAPHGIDSGEVYSCITEVPGVGSVHGLHIWSVSSTEVFLSCHICVDAGMESVDSDGLIGRINRMLEERFGISHTTLQVEKELICGAGGKSGECCR